MGSPVTAASNADAGSAAFSPHVVADLACSCWAGERAWAGRIVVLSRERWPRHGLPSVRNSPGKVPVLGLQA
jgi:hypothetical protein